MTTFTGQKKLLRVTQFKNCQLLLRKFILSFGSLERFSYCPCIMVFMVFLSADKYLLSRILQPASTKLHCATRQTTTTSRD